MKKIITFLSILASFTSYAGQSSIEFGYGTGTLEDNTISSKHAQFLYTPDRSIMNLFGGKVGYGLGFRITNYTADLFQASDIKTEFLEDVNVTAHNVFAQIHFQRGNLQLGFNIDLFGITNSTSANIQGGSQRIENETSNLFLYAENDRGTLNSQFFAAYNFSSVLVRAGLSHSLITFEDTGLSGDNNRQRFFDLFFLSLGYRL
jgi:hypothetical protein